MKRYFKRMKFTICLGIAVCSLQLFLTVQAQMYKGKVLDLAVAGSNELYRSLTILLLLSVGGILLGYGYLACRAKFTQNISRMMRDDIFKSLLRRDFKDRINLDRGEVIGLYTKQVSFIEREFSFNLSWLVSMLLNILFVIITIFIINPWLGIISIFVYTLPILLPKFAEKKLTEASSKRLSKVQEHLSKFNSWLRGFEIIKNYGIESEISEYYSSSNSDLKKTERDAEIVFAKTTGVSFMGTMGSQVILVIITGIMVFRGIFTAGDFVAFLSLIGMLKSPIYWVAKLIQSIISTKPTRDMVFEFIDYKGSSKKTRAAIVNLDVDSIDIENVSFGFDDNMLLKDLNMSFKAGQKYLITGESGCGKSTIMNLLLGYMDVNRGEVLLNGNSACSISNLSDFFSIARQEAVLFDDTILNNITLYDDSIDKTRIFEVLKKLGLERFADDDGINMQIKSGGKNLSGGEKKRISLARFLLRDAPVLILDEPLANIDLSNVDNIEDLILSINDKTVIVISHQFSQHKLNKFNAIYNIKGGRGFEKVLA